MTSVGNVRDPILIETSQVARESLGDALAALPGCWKASSLLWMHANGFPVLPGLILRGWSEQAKEAVIRFSRERKNLEFLVRIEKPGQRWTRRRGGYNIPLEGARGLVERLYSEGMLAILLEPASSYADLYSLTSVCDVAAGKVDVEVVGPGFDASDILRADVAPHERFELFLGDNTTESWDFPQFQTTRSYLVGPDSYRGSVRRRLVKIGARRRNPAFPDELMDAKASSSDLENLIEEAEVYLRETGQTALLDHLDHYQPIAESQLGGFLTELSRLVRAVRASKVAWRTLSMAGSFLSRDRLVIWDFFPAGHHETGSLLDLRTPSTPT